jgi:hypothetical protein
MLQKIILILAISFSFSLCKKTPAEQNLFARFDSSKFADTTWRIIPSDNLIVKFEKSGTFILTKTKEKKEIFLFEDSRGVRFQNNVEDITPIGYFLYSEKSTNSWGGVYENKIVRLELVVSRSESILE